MFLLHRKIFQAHEIKETYRPTHVRELSDFIPEAVLSESHGFVSAISSLTKVH
jgi:hypothetical protein